MNVPTGLFGNGTARDEMQRDKVTKARARVRFESRGPLVEAMAVQTGLAFRRGMRSKRIRGIRLGRCRGDKRW